MVGRQTQRIIDVDDHRAALAQQIGVDLRQPGVEILRVQLAEFDDLRVDGQTDPARHLEDAALVFGGQAFGTLGLGFRVPRVILAHRVIEEVLHVGACLAAPQQIVLVDQLGVARGADKLLDARTQEPHLARQQVDQAMGVAGDEVDRAVFQV